MKKIYLSLALFLGFAAQSNAQQPVLLKDIISGSVGGFTMAGQYAYTYYPFNVVWQHGSNIYFLANTASTLSSGGSYTNDLELWMSDGTTAGTMILKDICPGGVGSDPTDFKDINGTLYFTANDGVSGRELWKTDGTPGGTVMVKDIIAGSVGGFSTTGQFGYYNYPFNVVWQNGSDFYFTANDYTSSSGDNIELWKSNGTAAGTVRIKDIYAGNTGSYPQDFKAVNGTLYFTADDGVAGRELWKTDGTTGGTVMVKDIIAGSVGGFSTTGQFGYYSYPFTVVWQNGADFYFTADGYTSSSGDDIELWKSDGTAAGTVRVKDIYAGNTGSYPQDFKAVNGALYFTADNGTSGRELWKTDGTTGGTVMVKDIIAGSVGGFSTTGQFGYYSYPFTVVWQNGADFYFTADGYTSSSGDDIELWKSDGTTAGTVRLMDIYPGNTGSYPMDFKDINGILYFTADNGSSGRELWKTDGTSGGTVMVKDIISGGIGGFSLADQYGYSAHTFTVVWQSGSTFYFTANNYASAPGGSYSNGIELWKSDGTNGGTVCVKDINPGNPGSYPVDFRVLNGTLYFTADNGTNGYELWKTDGTPAGTVMVKDILPGSAGGFTLAAQYAYNMYDFNPSFMIGNDFYFAANDYATVPGAGSYDNDPELWKSDGTTAGTVKVLDIYASPTIGSYPADFTVALNKVFFTAEDATNGRELWVINAAASSTGIKDQDAGEWVIFPNPASDKVNIVCTSKGPEQANQSLLVYDVNGKTVYQEKLTATDFPFTHTIDISTVPAGIYMFQITDGKTNVLRKIIKQ